MKRNLTITLACAVGLASGSLYAQTGVGTSPAPGAGAPTATSQPAGAGATASMYQNRTVNDAQGNRLGEIRRVINDPQSNQPRYAVIRSADNREVAVPISAMRRSEVGVSEFTLEADAAKLKAAPEFKESEMSKLNTREGSQKVYTHWNANWDDQAGATMDAATTNTGTSTPGGRQSTGTGVSGNTNTGTGAPGSDPATSAAGESASEMPSTPGSRQSTGTGASGTDNTSTGQPAAAE